MTSPKTIKREPNTARLANPVAPTALSGLVFWAVAVMAVLSGWTLLGSLAFATLSATLTLFAFALAYTSSEDQTDG